MTADERNERVLPPGISTDAFERALNAFARAVGDEGVVRGEKELAEYRDPFAFASSAPREYAASAALKPSSVKKFRRS